MIHIFDYSLIHATIRTSTAILFAALAAVITQQANILNVGVEGIMLFGAFTAVAVSYFTGSWFLAVIVAVIVGVIVAAVMALAHLKYKADVFAVGMAINMLAIAVTRFLLNTVLHASGSFTNKKIIPIPNITIKAFSKNPVLNSVLNNYSIFEILGIVLVFVLWYILYRTVWGLRVRSVGLYPDAAKTAGINVVKCKTEVMLYSGILGGLAGAYLSLGYSNFFAENMTNGRGFMGVAAMFFGAANPVFTWIGCLVFGFSDAVGSKLQSYGAPSQFVLMIPYIVTILVLTISLVLKVKKEKKAKSSLNQVEEAK